MRQAEVKIGNGCVKGASCLVPVIHILTGLGVFCNYKLHTGLCQQRFMWSVGAKLKAPTARIPIVLRPPSKPLLVANSTPHLREQWFISGVRHDACVSPVPHTHQSPFIHYFPTDTRLKESSLAGILILLKFCIKFLPTIVLLQSMFVVHSILTEYLHHKHSQTTIHIF